MKILLSVLLFFATYLFTISSFSQVIEGYAFFDENNNMLFDENEEGLSGVAISNGYDVVTTDFNGKYELNIDEDETVFLIKPSGYISRLSEGHVTQNFYFNKPKGSPSLHFKGVKAQRLKTPVNFPLYKNEGEDTLKISILGDTQTKTIDDVYYLSKVVSEKMIEENYDFIVPLGDLTYDNLRLFEPIKDVLSKLNAPVFYVYGNHDRNYDAVELDYRDETYERSFGPSYYAFNYGNHSFIALNNVYPKPHHEYDAKIDEKQLHFIENYLKTIPKSNTIHLLMHIPLEQLTNIEEFSGLFKDHAKVKAYAGHTHTQFFEIVGEEFGWRGNPVEELVAGAVCGSWWHGEKDIFGVPLAMMSDGTPKGYWIMNIEEGKETYDYKVSEPDNRQMHIWTPFEFDKEIIGFEGKKIIANVYAGNEATKVEIKIGDGNWKAMEYTKDYDPFFKRLYELQKKGITPGANTIRLGKPRISHHLWQISIPSDLKKGIHLVSVRATNKYGLNAHSKTMLFHKTNNEQYFVKKKKMD